MRPYAFAHALAQVGSLDSEQFIKWKLVMTALLMVHILQQGIVTEGTHPMALPIVNSTQKRRTHGDTSP